MNVENSARIEKITREVLDAFLRSKAASTPATAYDAAAGVPALAANGAANTLRPACVRDDGFAHGVDAPAVPEQVAKLQATTSSQLAVGHRGLRFRTELYLRMREGHADARDAVHSHVPDEFATQQQLKALITRCKDKAEYLLYPNQGRRLSEASRTIVEQQHQVADIQLIAGDGLSSIALQTNGPETLHELKKALTHAGYSVAPAWFVRYARIGVQDEIGVLCRAKATIILVGERPGLGTGDSLSLYLAINPKLDQDNAEKNCISNVRPIGIKANEAAALSVKILREGFARGGGGVALGYGFTRR